MYLRQIKCLLVWRWWRVSAACAACDGRQQRLWDIQSILALLHSTSNASFLDFWYSWGRWSPREHLILFGDYHCALRTNCFGVLSDLREPSDFSDM